MIDVERRLHHAARELREVEIEPPPLSALVSPLASASSRRPSGLLARVPALVMPVLFVLGGLAVVAAGAGRQVDDTPDPTAATAATDVTADQATVAPDPPTLTAREEIALIGMLAPADNPASSAGPVPAPAASTAPPTALRNYR